MATTTKTTTPAPVHIIEYRYDAAQRLHVLVESGVEFLDVGFGVDVGDLMGDGLRQMSLHFGHEIAVQTLGELFAYAFVHATVHLLVGKRRILAGSREKLVNGRVQPRPILVLVILLGQLGIPR